MRKVITVFALVMLASVFFYQAKAQDDQALIGKEAPAFKLKNIDGSMVSLDNYRRSEGVIVVFTCNHCPYSKLYEDRINELNENYEAKGFPVIAINPNDPVAYPEDSWENMKVRAEEKAFSFPYLFDETQEIAAAYGATRTPHTYVLKFDEEEETFTVVYVGAIDDNPKESDQVEDKFIEAAIKEIKAGNAVSNNYTKAIGCSIKWKKS